MGGTLVYRNQIGVDHRYANAGKWSEVKVRGARGGTVVGARADELQLNQMKLLRVDGQRIVLARTESGYTAFDDRCPHRGASLADGVMICGVVQCPWHGSQFDSHNGAVRAGPAMHGISTYPVEDNGRELLVRLSGVTKAAPIGDVSPAPDRVSR
jgi:nitrite reductase/ring-hydroxylating ferredoxin subunit